MDNLARATGLKCILVYDWQKKGMLFFLNVLVNTLKILLYRPSMIITSCEIECASAFILQKLKLVKHCFPFIFDGSNLIFSYYAKLGILARWKKKYWERATILLTISVQSKQEIQAVFPAQSIAVLYGGI
jgi:hypothetical protein